MRHAQSYESFSTAHSLLGESAISAFNDTGWDVPPSTKVRVAQRMHLVPKTFFSVHDAQRQAAKMTKGYRDLQACGEKIQCTVEEATTAFNQDGFKLQADLRRVTTCLANGFNAVAESTSETMKTLETHCKGVAAVEPEYRKSYKEAVKAQEKLEYAQSHSASATKLASLSRDLERKKITLDLSKGEYDRVTLELGLKFAHDFALQLVYNCQMITTSFCDATGMPNAPSNGSPFTGHSGVHREYTTGEHHSHYCDQEDNNDQEILFTQPLDPVGDDDDDDDLRDISSIPEQDVQASSFYPDIGLDNAPDIPKVESPTRILRKTQPLDWNSREYSPVVGRYNAPPPAQAYSGHEISNEWNQWAE